MTSDEPIVHPVLAQHLILEEDRRSLYAIRQGYRREALSSWRIITVCQTAAMLAILVWTYSVYRESVNRQPIAVGIDPHTGASFILHPEALTLRLTDQDLRYHLGKWAEDYFQRMIIGEKDYRKSLQFMSQQAAGVRFRKIESDLAEFGKVRHGDMGEKEVKAEQTVINNVDDVVSNGCTNDSFAKTGKLCTAWIQIEESTTEQGQISHTWATVQVEFVLLTKISEELRRDNPIGLVITNFHVTPASETRQEPAQ